MPMEVKDLKYGIPQLKKFPMPDARHVRSAIKFFNYVTPKYEKQLAAAILRRMKEYGLSFDDFTVGDENRFKKYVPKRTTTMNNDYLAHYGILGMHWGIRRFQPYPKGYSGDGKFTEKDNRKIFVSGSSKTQDRKSGYYRHKLPEAVQKDLKGRMRAGNKILVGDAPGIDRQVQDFLKENKYDNVEVYSSGTEARYKADKNWKSNFVDASQYKKGSPEWLAEKDKAMARAADEGIAVILDEGARATRRNIERLMSSGKDVTVVELQRAGEQADRVLDEIGKRKISVMVKQENVRREYEEKYYDLLQDYEKKFRKQAQELVKNDPKLKKYDILGDGEYWDDGEMIRATNDKKLKEIDNEYTANMHKAQQDEYALITRAYRDGRSISEQHDKEVLDARQELRESKLQYENAAKRGDPFANVYKITYDSDERHLKWLLNEGSKDIEQASKEVFSLEKRGLSTDKIAYKLNMSKYAVEDFLNDNTLRKNYEKSASKQERPRKEQPLYSEADLRRVESLRRQGKTLKEISRATGINMDAVNDLLYDAGLEFE